MKDVNMNQPASYLVTHVDTKDVQHTYFCSTVKAYLRHLRKLSQQGVEEAQVSMFAGADYLDVVLYGASPVDTLVASFSQGTIDLAEQITFPLLEPEEGNIVCISDTPSIDDLHQAELRSRDVINIWE
jgi:hypothetical protein